MSVRYSSFLSGIAPLPPSSFGFLAFLLLLSPSREEVETRKAFRTHLVFPLRFFFCKQEDEEGIEATLVKLEGYGGGVGCGDLVTTLGPGMGIAQTVKKQSCLAHFFLYEKKLSILYKLHYTNSTICDRSMKIPYFF